MGRVKRIATVLTLVTLSFTTLVLSAGVAHASTATDEAKFVSLINQERSSRGLRTLVVKSDLVSVARKHSADMAAKGTIWHGDSTPYKISGWTIYGENVGMGPTVADLHRAFMDSPDHRANILEKAFNQIGVGVVIKDGTIFVTEIFVKRGSTTTTTTTTTTTKKTTTSRTTSTAPKPAPAPKPVAKPAPRPAAPKPATASPMNVTLLVQLVGLDARSVDPATGHALGL